jgi:hypothetical protein
MVSRASSSWASLLLLVLANSLWLSSAASSWADLAVEIQSASGGSVTATLSPGTHSSAGAAAIVVNVGSTVVVQGAGTTATTVDGGYDSQFFAVDGHLSVRNVTLQKSREKWAPVQVRSNGHLSALGCAFSRTYNSGGGSSLWGSGGAISCESASLDLTACAFDGCTSEGAHGGALFLSGSHSRPDAAVSTVTDCTFANSYASGSGGAAMLDQASALFSACTFSSGKAVGGEGGAVCITADRTHALNLTGCTLERNAALYGSGGGVSGGGGAQLILRESNLSANAAAVDGGGAHVLLGELTVAACLLAANTAVARGGGLYFAGSRLRLERSQLLANRATSAVLGKGAGAYVSQDLSALPVEAREELLAVGAAGAEDDEAAVLSRSILHGNAAGMHGGGLYVWQSRVGVERCTISANRAGSAAEGGALVAGEAAGGVSGGGVFVHGRCGDRQHQPDHQGHPLLRSPQAPSAHPSLPLSALAPLSAAVFVSH